MVIFDITFDYLLWASNRGTRPPRSNVIVSYLLHSEREIGSIVEERDFDDECMCVGTH